MGFILEKCVQYRLKFSTKIGRWGRKYFNNTDRGPLEVEKTGLLSLPTQCRNQVRERGSKEEKWIRKEVMIFTKGLMCLRHCAMHFPYDFHLIQAYLVLFHFTNIASLYK